MPTGRNAHLRVSKQTAFGTPAATGPYFRFRSEDLFTDIEEVTPPNILGVPFRGPTYQGLFTSEGPVALDAHPEILGFFLLSGLGPGTSVPLADTGPITIDVVASAGTFTRAAGSFVTDGFAVGDAIITSGFANAGNNTTKVIQSVTATVITVTDPSGLVDETGGGDERIRSARSTHTFVPRLTQFAPECWLQPLTFENHKDLGDAFQFVDSVVNQLQLEFGATDAKVMGIQAGIMARTMGEITPTSPSGFEATRAFLWHEAAVTLPDPTAFLIMQRLTFVVNNNQVGLPFLDGTKTYARIRGGDEPTIVTVSGRMLANSNETAQYFAGAERYLKVVWTGPALGPSNYRFELHFPRFRYQRHRVSVGGPAELFVDFEAEAKYDPATADTPAKAVLVNGLSGY
jgi:hypothetical protein